MPNITIFGGMIIGERGGIDAEKILSLPAELYFRQMNFINH